jgi:hypothetical protein
MNRVADVPVIEENTKISTRKDFFFAIKKRIEQPLQAMASAGASTPCHKLFRKNLEKI